MIERVTIERFMSIRDAAIDLGRLNVLIGTNGAGKSNFIAFFELSQALLSKRLGSYVLTHGRADGILYNGMKYSDHLTGMIDFGNTNLFCMRLEPTADDRLYVSETADFFNSQNDSEKKYDRWHYKVWDSNVEESSILDSKLWRSQYIKDFLNGFTVYHFHDTSMSSPMRRACKVDDNRSLRKDGSNLPAMLYKFKMTSPSSLRMIEAVVHSVAPYFKRFILEPDALDGSYIKLVWEEVDTDAYRDAGSLSDGTLRFIVIAALLLQPELPSTVIIDEPEIGLHPSAIIKLSGLVSKASLKAQIIIATQSVNLVNCFDVGDIIVVDRQDGQSVFRHLDREKLSVWLSEYSIGEIWEKNLIGG